MIKRSLSRMAAAVSWHCLVFFILCWYGAYTQRSQKAKSRIYLNCQSFKLLERAICDRGWELGRVFSVNLKNREPYVALKRVAS